jgi:hypothetical protein
MPPKKSSRTRESEPRSTECSAAQKGTAAQIRYNGKYRSTDDQKKLHEIVHSGDLTGPYAEKPNRFRDPTNTFDPEAEQLLQRLADK